MELDRVALKFDVFRFSEPVDQMKPAYSGRKDFEVEPEKGGEAELVQQVALPPLR